MLSTWVNSLGHQSSSRGLQPQFKTMAEVFEDGFALLESRKPKKSIYLYIDELEVVYSSKAQFSRDVELATSLVRVIRDMNEKFRERSIPIFLICGIRREISERILGGDTAKIVSDLGEEVSWTRSSWDRDSPKFIHPLFEIILRRSFYSLRPGSRFFPNEERQRIIHELFPFYETGGPGRKGTQAELLDLTTYRPRDVSILFGAAQRVDQNRSSFRRETFQRIIRKPLHDELWRDFSEALRSEFSREQVELLGKVLRRLTERFYFSDFLAALDEFSADPTMAKMLDGFSDADWAEALKQLYVLGAVGNVEQGERIQDRYKFYFRGYTDGLIISPKVEIVKQRALIEA